MTTIPKAERHTYKSICQDATAEYRSLLDSGRYGPTKANPKATGEPDLPNGMVAAIEKAVANSLKKATGGRGTGTGNGGNHNGSRTPGKRFDGECYNCGKKGHMANKCRAPKKDTPTNGSGSGSPWRTTPPEGDPEKVTLKRGKKKFRWFTKCKRWTFHFAEKHDEVMAKMEAKRNRHSAQAQVADHGNQDPDSDDDFISFGGIISQE